MRPFAYARPETLEGALALLRDGGGGAAVLAGGTDLLVGMRSGAVTPRSVVDVKRVTDLGGGIATHEGNGASPPALRIGAATVMADVADDPRIRLSYPALAEAARAVGSAQIRNRATIAGNICNASPAADTVPALLVYGALVVVASADGRRRVPLEDFIVGPGETVLRPGEMVIAVELPRGGGPRASAFARVSRRHGFDLATVNGACALGAGGRAVFAFGAVGPRPVVVREDTGVLADGAASAVERDAAVAALVAHAAPITDVRASREYREAMLRVLTRRLLRTCLGPMPFEV